MRKWFIDNAYVFFIALVAYFSTLFVPILVYPAGLLALGYVLWAAFKMGQDWVPAERSRHLENSRENSLTPDEPDTELLTDVLREEPIETPQISLNEIPGQLLSGVNGLLNDLFPSSKKRSKSKCDSNVLTEAAKRCREQSQLQNSEVREITKALKAFTQEARSVREQVEQKLSESRYGYFQISKEQTALIESRPSSRCNQLLLEELTDLMNNYPTCSFETNPCLESIELYTEELAAHHEKILTIASVLLPNLSCLLNEGKATTYMTI